MGMMEGDEVELKEDVSDGGEKRRYEGGGRGEMRSIGWR